MRNARLDELQAGIKIASRNNNLRHVDNTTLMAEREEELKSLLMKVEESEKASLKFNIKKKLRSWHLVSSLHGKRRGKGESSDRFHSSQALKSLWMVTAAMELEDDCFLTGKL